MPIPWMIASVLVVSAALGVTLTGVVVVDKHKLSPRYTNAMNNSTKSTRSLKQRTGGRIKNRINQVAMRFFRDLSRSKARRRRYGNDHALVPLLLGKVDPIIPNDDDLDDLSMETFTLEELASYRGEKDPEDKNGDMQSVLYLSIKGRVYDVSAGSKFYGPGSNYHAFVGTDASRAFATGCLNFLDTTNCLTSNLEGITEPQKKELDRWLELYELHDKYHLVGRLVQNDPVNELLAADDEQEIVANSEDEKLTDQ
eukprot:scaffold18479_cov47-Attheya_sp.AAC.2